MKFKPQCAQCFTVTYDLFREGNRYVCCRCKYGEGPKVTAPSGVNLSTPPTQPTGPYLNLDDYDSTKIGRSVGWDE